ncbi:MAG: hypothetical protein KJ964_08715 [Verrucomicrobia bacterium]|nr:hypothetical protein [Verrucomicrobiota bacterium]MBU1735059.1 hypothetical protein [Verrucomicrobiota bacterium]MBU1856577.1 hypothetical protein [Verrucomicrobiota bacterium]
MNGYMEDYCPEHVVIEDNATISFRVTFVAHGVKRGKNLRVLIRSGAYVGAGCVILPGVTIGRKAVVGAGSVVVKDIPDGAVAAGNPARVLRWLEGYGPDTLAGKAPIVPVCKSENVNL